MYCLTLLLLLPVVALSAQYTCRFPACGDYACVLAFTKLSGVAKGAFGPLAYTALVEASDQKHFNINIVSSFGPIASGGKVTMQSPTTSCGNVYSFSASDMIAVTVHRNAPFQVVGGFNCSLNERNSVLCEGGPGTQPIIGYYMPWVLSTNSSCLNPDTSPCSCGTEPYITNTGVNGTVQASFIYQSDKVCSDVSMSDVIDGVVQPGYMVFGSVDGVQVILVGGMRPPEGFEVEAVYKGQARVRIKNNVHHKTWVDKVVRWWDTFFLLLCFIGAVVFVILVTTMYFWVKTWAEAAREVNGLAARLVDWLTYLLLIPLVLIGYFVNQLSERFGTPTFKQFVKAVDLRGSPSARVCIVTIVVFIYILAKPANADCTCGKNLAGLTSCLCSVAGQYTLNINQTQCQLSVSESEEWYSTGTSALYQNEYSGMDVRVTPNGCNDYYEFIEIGQTQTTNIVNPSAFSQAINALPGGALFNAFWGQKPTISTTTCRACARPILDNVAAFVEMTGPYHVLTVTGCGSTITLHEGESSYILGVKFSPKTGAKQSLTTYVSTKYGIGMTPQPDPGMLVAPCSNNINSLRSLLLGSPIPCAVQPGAIPFQMEMSSYFATDVATCKASGVTSNGSLGLGVTYKPAMAPFYNALGVGPGDVKLFINVSMDCMSICKDPVGGILCTPGASTPLACPNSAQYSSPPYYPDSTQATGVCTDPSGAGWSLQCSTPTNEIYCEDTMSATMYNPFDTQNAGPSMYDLGVAFNQCPPATSSFKMVVPVTASPTTFTAIIEQAGVTITDSAGSCSGTMATVVLSQTGNQVYATIAGAQGTGTLLVRCAGVVATEFRTTCGDGTFIIGAPTSTQVYCSFIFSTGAYKSGLTANYGQGSSGGVGKGNISYDPGTKLTDSTTKECDKSGLFGFLCHFDNIFKGFTNWLGGGSCESYLAHNVWSFGDLPSSPLTILRCLFAKLVQVFITILAMLLCVAVGVLMIIGFVKLFLMGAKRAVKSPKPDDGRLESVSTIIVSANKPSEVVSRSSGSRKLM